MSDHINTDESKKMEKELAELQECYTSACCDIDYHLKLGWGYLSLGRIDKVADASKNAVLINPDSFMAWALLGIAYLGKHMYTEAYVAFSNAVDNWEGEEMKEKCDGLLAQILKDLAALEIFRQPTKRVCQRAKTNKRRKNV